MDFFFIKRFALPCIYQSNHIKILPLIYIVKKKGNWIIMKNIHDQVFFFCIIIYIIYNEEKRKVQTYRVAIKLSTMSAILLYVVSVFSSYAKNTIYTLYDTFRLSLDTGLWCIHRNLSNFETRKRLLMNVYIHLSVKY